MPSYYKHDGITVNQVASISKIVNKYLTNDNTQHVKDGVVLSLNNIPNNNGMYIGVIGTPARDCYRFMANIKHKQIKKMVISNKKADRIVFYKPLMPE